MESEQGKLRILFLCTGNSCRSQRAEGWARHLKSHKIGPFSAGTDAKGVNPLAIRVMREAGVDISSQRSKHVSELLDQRFDYVVRFAQTSAKPARFSRATRSCAISALRVRQGPEGARKRLSRSTAKSVMRSEGLSKDCRNLWNDLVRGSDRSDGRLVRGR